MAEQELEQYLKDGFGKVDGWCNHLSLRITSSIYHVGCEAGVTGGACEIGVYRGKFFLGLANITDQHSCLAIDIFDNQELNIDNSGAGATSMLDTFRENVSLYVANPTRVSIKVADTLTFSVSDISGIITEFGKFQLFSIDGGHTAEHVINDFDIAEQVTYAGGSIIVDDFTNMSWPGVMEGIARLFILRKPRFVPLLIGYNKLFLTGVSYHRRYIEQLSSRLREQLPEMGFLHPKLFGYDVISIT